jgi:uncharacterized protein YjbI with pentapeptide repeats
MPVIDAEITESELQARYAAGERRFSHLDITADGSKALAGAVLDEIELIDCFVATSFRGASLRRAIVHANVKTCDFTDADLTGADFRGSALCSTTFEGAKMKGADFTGAFNHGYDLSPGEAPDW